MLSIKPFVRKNDIVIQELGEELLVYDLKSNKAFSLNETSALVWHLSTGQNSITEIVKIATNKLNKPVTAEFVWLALGQLKKEKLLENEAEIPELYEGATRREVIRKVGLASLVTLPVICSLVAPLALHAQSGNCSGTPIQLGCRCPTNDPLTCESSCCGVVNSSSDPRICVTPSLKANGAACRSVCECVGGCCGFGFVCVDCGSKAPGDRCRTNNECSSGLCGGPGGTCS